MRKVLKYAGGLIAFLAILVAAAWLLWMPSAKEPGYVFVMDWGGKGSGLGQFHDPTGIAVSDGEVFVSDARNSRIQVFDFEGRFLRQFGELGRPMNLSIAHHKLYVADYWNDRIEIFSLDGTPLQAIGGPGSGPGQLKSPGGVDIGPEGNLYVADFYNQRIQKLGPDGRFIRQWGQTGEIGAGAGKFSYPTDVAVAEDGTLYVADGYNDRIQVFSPEGRFLRKWGGPFASNIHGPYHGWFATVTSVALGPQGNVFAADFYNDRIQKFAPDGTFLTAFGEGQLDKAIAVAVAKDGTVFAADYGNHRVQRWQPKPESSQ